MKYTHLIVVAYLSYSASAFYVTEGHNGRKFDRYQPLIKERFRVSNAEAPDKLGNPQVRLYMDGVERALLRETLRTAIRLLEREDNENYELRDRNDYNDQKENSFYLPYIISLINEDMAKEGKRERVKRNTFDPISHQGGLAGFGGYGSAAEKQRKRPFTFQELLPFLLNEMRRNSRGVSTRRS